MNALSRAVYSLLSTSAAALARGGFPAMRRRASRLGALLWHGLPGRRRLAETNIQRHLGLGAAAARELARESFDQNARSFLEAVLTPHFGFDHPLLEIEDPALMARFQTKDRPRVGATGHLGAWELEAALLGEFAPDRPRLVVVRRYSYAPVNQLMADLRGGRGATVLGHREAVFPVLRALRHSGVAAFLVDHNASRSESLFLPFFADVAAVNMGPALLAVRGEAEIWPIALLRRGEKYVFTIEPPLDTRSLDGDRDAKIEAAARFYTEALERLIRRAPEQWFWMHNRWKTRPPAAEEQAAPPQDDAPKGSHP